MKSSIKTDISLANQSKLKVPSLEYEKMKQQIRKVKYPTSAISIASKLQNKIDSFKNEKVRKKLQQVLNSLNSYRKVRGDGNCFFRALGFSYLSSVYHFTYNNCFSMINQINLDCCYSDTIPKDFQKFYDHQFLVDVLKSDWELAYSRCLNQSRGIQKKALLKLFDQHPYLDFIVVLYFRSICLKALYKYQQQLTNFIAGGEQASIRKYSEQTEGISINLCSKILNITILVFQVRKQQVNSYKYDVSKISRNAPNVCLLFYESHYDIIEYNENIDAQESALKKKQSYYGQVNQKMFQGQCIQCKQQNYVYQMSNLCSKCHNFSLTSLNEYQKDKFIKGRCAQCQNIREDISLSFGLCKRCIKIQNEVQQRRKQEALRKRCVNCNKYYKVDAQTGLCSFCLDHQKKMMNNLQSSKSQQKIQERESQNIRTSHPVRIVPPTRENQYPFLSTVKQSQKSPREQSKDQNPPNNSSIQFGTYENFTCKICKKFQMKQPLINGYCYNCQRKYN